jgi:serine/threonine protein kinase
VFIDPHKLKDKFPFFKSLYVIMDYGYMDLRKFLHQRQILTFQEAFNICRNITYVFYHFNSLGFLHRDLKPDNFLIDPNTLQIKIIDFGHSGIQRKGGQIKFIKQFVHFINSKKKI